MVSWHNAEFIQRKTPKLQKKKKKKITDVITDLVVISHITSVFRVVSVSD